MAIMSQIESWDRQQERYIGGREARFDAMFDAISWLMASATSHHSADGRPIVVDLGCGPAAIGRRLLQRFPTATYVGVDVDPVLLHLAREVADDAEVGAMRIIDRDVADPTWLSNDLAGRADVVCSSTALHWLPPEALDQALINARRALRPGGILLNADHLGDDPASPCMRLADWVGDRDEADASADAAPSWDEWWAAARSDPDLAPLCVRRDRIFPPRDANGSGREDAAGEVRPLLADFVAATRRAGFVDVDTIWQRFDDRVVMALAPDAAPA